MTCDGKLSRTGKPCGRPAQWRVWAEDESAPMFACHHHLAVVTGYVLGSEIGTVREFRVVGAWQQPSTYHRVAHVDRLWL